MSLSRFAVATFFASSLLALAADPPSDKPYGLEAAQAGMKDFTAGEGLQAELFAAEPQIQNPTNIDIDARGRVWAVEAVNYRSTMRPWKILRPEGDRVVILEGTNGNGEGVKETVFWQSPELKAPLGICVLPQEHGTKVIVSAAPNVWLLTDTKGDDHADKVQKLFTVGGNWDHDHQVHAFSFGPDGKFYFNMGNEGRKLMDADGKVLVDLSGNEIENNGHPYRQGMVFRCDLDLEAGVAKNVETLAWNFRNIYEVAVDSFGTMWQSDNDDDGNKGVRINYVMQYGNYGYSDEMTGQSWQTPRTNIETEIPLRHWHQNDPGSIPNLLQTGSGSPTGIQVNEGALLGAALQNQVLHCDAGPRVVRAYPVTNYGAGYHAEMRDVLTSKDSWYRPADLSIAPDGSLFVADWYDAGVGGHNMADHEAGRIRGRIYRVAPPGKAYATAAPDFSTADGCALALQSPNRATQYVAWQKLHALGDQAAPALQQLAQSTNPRLRARALGVLAHTPSQAIEALRKGLNDADADVRIAAVRLVSQMAKSGGLDTSSLEGDTALLRKLLGDRDPQVRREIALALHGAKEVAQLWTMMASQHDGQDRWYLEALGIGAAGNDTACFDNWLAAMGGPTGHWDTAAGRDIIWRLRTPKTLPFLAKLATDPATPKDVVPRYLRALDFLPASDEKTKALLDLARLAEKNDYVAGEALQRLKGSDSNPEVKALVMEMLKASRGTNRFVELVRDFKLDGQGPGLLEVAMARPDSPEGVDAMKMLLGKEGAQLLPEQLKEAKAAKVVEALGNTADARAVPLLLPLVSEPAAPADLRKQSVKSLAQSQAGIEALLKLAKDGKFPDDLRFTATQALAAVQLPKLKDSIAQLFPSPNALGGTTLPPISELSKKPGDAAHGKELFAKESTSCITCHRVSDLGVDFGPALSEIGTKLGKDAIFEAIIDPNAGIAMGFETTMLTLKDGNAAVGIVRSETPEELVLAMPRGITVRYKKGEIAERTKLPTSMMPSGLNQALSVQDLVDVVAYLSTLKAAPPK